MDVVWFLAWLAPSPDLAWSANRLSASRAGGAVSARADSWLRKSRLPVRVLLPAILSEGDANFRKDYRLAAVVALAVSGEGSAARTCALQRGSTFHIHTRRLAQAPYKATSDFGLIRFSRI